ncbi:MAG: GNAT family N-acetyltransferase, partial [Planctomycetota bacterium]
MNVETRLIAGSDTHPLRHAILRPAQPLAEMQYPGDDDRTTFHLGAFVDGDLIGIASVYQQPMPDAAGDTHHRLRGMAVAPDHAGRGIGRQLVEVSLDTVRAAGGTLLWCNARASAKGFYERLGFTVQGDVFDLAGIGPHYVMSR